MKSNVSLYNLTLDDCLNMPFEQSFKEWLKKNASDILMSNKDNAGISVFKDSIVEQRAQTINNIGVQNKY